MPASDELETDPSKQKVIVTDHLNTIEEQQPSVHLAEESLTQSSPNKQQEVIEIIEGSSKSIEEQNQETKEPYQLNEIKEETEPNHDISGDNKSSNSGEK